MTDVVLTTDRTMMSNHRQKEFLGFGTTGAPVIFPEFVWLWMFAPKMKCDARGRPWQAPYGLRKLEARLKDQGFDAEIIVPHKLENALSDAKVMIISHHDFFGFGPPSSTFASLFEKETVNARSFKRFMEEPFIAEAKKRGVTIIAGGPAAWQWRYREQLMEKWGIDCVFDGEGEREIVNLIGKAMAGEQLPKFMEMSHNDAPTLEEISCIRDASVNGLVEIMRGCPRGCKFCSVTNRPLRFIPLDRVEQELKVNAEAGITGGTFHSEDVLLYGAKGLEPNPEKLIELNILGKRYYRNLAWAHASVSAIVKGERDHKLISRLEEIIIDGRQKWWGAEIGVETASVPLASKIMPQKAKPYDIRDWPELVKEAAGIMQDASLVPAMTVIAGLPDETEDDVLRTVDLIDDLWDFKAIIMPMFFVPMGMLSQNDWFKAYKLSDAHMELLKKCLTHGARQGKDILRDYFSDRWYGPLMKPFYWTFINVIEVFAKRGGYWSEPDLDRREERKDRTGAENA